MNTKLRRALQPTTVAALIAIVVGAVLGIFSTLGLYANDTRVTRTRDLQSALDTVLASVTDAETGERGFVITGDDAYLEPHRWGTAHAGEAIRALGPLIGDKAIQQQRLAQLRSEVDRKLQELERAVDVRRTKGFEAAVQIVRTNVGKTTMDRIRAIVNDMRREEDMELGARRRESARSVRIAVITEIATALAALALIVVTASSSRRRLDEMEARERVSRELAAIVASSDDAILGKDLGGTITSWNRAAERMFGFTAAEAVGQSIAIIIPDDHQAQEDDVRRRVRRGESVVHAETVRRRKDGTTLPVSLTVSPIRMAHGAVVGASTIAQDISERKRADAALADLQQRLQALVGASGVLLESPRVDDVLPATLKLARELVTADGYAIWRFAAASRTWQIGACSGISDAFAATIIASYGDGGVSTVPFSEPLVAEDVRALPMLEERREAYRSEGIQSLLAVPLIISGEATATLVLYYRARHVFSEVEIQTARALGNLTATAVTTAELYDAQRRGREQAAFLAQAGAALARARDYEETLRAVANLTVPTIADWCAVDIVAEGGELHRLAVAHVDPAKIELARTLQERYPADPQSPYGVHQVIRTGAPVMMSHIPDELVVAAARDAGHLQTIRELGLTSYMCVPLLAQGRTLGVLTFVTAESGRRYTAADLRFAEDLAARAALAMDNARAYGETRRANRLKDEFLGTLSHELRTPLNAILGYARMLRSGTLAIDRQARALEILERNATSLTQIVEDVLDVSRIISGKTRLNVQAVELPSVVEQAVATVRPTAEAKGVRLHATIAHQALLVSGDPDRLQQVIWNLLSNAVKFTPHGEEVQIRLVRVDSHVEIVVSDTGRGISPEFLPHVFERFRQADSQFSREHGGLGLGLAISRHLVELHGGTIHAASDGEGKGATFRVKLPLTIVRADRSLERMRETPRPERGSLDGPLDRLDGVHVVAVDDEPDALTLLLEILEAAGAQVTAASSVEEAIDILMRDAPHVLVADIGMPGLDGLELIRRIRQSPHRAIRDVPAAALTAYARSEDRTKTLLAGFQLHLAKPIDPNELVAAIAALARRGDASVS